MTRQVTGEEVWAATIEDRPNALGEKLRALAEGGINLEMVISRRHYHRPGEGVVYVTPIQGGQQTEVAKKAGFSPAEGMHSLKVVASDQLGLGAELTRKLGKAGINLRGFSGAAVGDKVVMHFAFDSAADVDKATEVFRE